MTPPRPARSSAQPRRIVGLVARTIVIALLAIGGYGIWYLFLQPAGPAPVGQASLPPVPSNAAASGTAPASSAAASGGSPVASTATSGGAIDGTWNVDTSIGSFSDFTGSFVGYRVQEELGGVGANTAVGRTPDVTGSLTIAGTTVTAGTITADLTTLVSDDRRRDGQLSRQGIQTSTYPTATFTLSSPIELGSVPADGQEITVTAKGQLTLHGQTKDVELPLKARLQNGVIAAAGSLPIVFADYGIQKPTSFAVLSIADEGTMELQLFFSRA